ncbi:hypothetical protein GKODMF_12205 [Candidatus Electrothrix gigas]
MFPLSPFLRILEQDGFRLTIRDYDRIAMVLATDGDWTLQRLRSVLRTLLARNREQQDIFERRFDTFFADFADVQPVKVAWLILTSSEKSLSSSGSGNCPVFPTRSPDLFFSSNPRSKKNTLGCGLDFSSV